MHASTFNQQSSIASLTVLFADISDSTKLYEELGDIQARRITSLCLDTIKSISKNNQGTIIKTIGDEIMCSFPDPESATKATTQMHLALINSPKRELNRLSLRIGFHHGNVIKESGDIFGDAVNVAARVTGLAKKQQTLITKSTLEKIDPMHNVRFVEKTLVKGKSLPIEIYELKWETEGDSATCTIEHRDDIPNNSLKPTLHIQFENTSFTMDDKNPLFSMGRSHKNDLTIEDDRISRHHAHIEFYRGEFFVVDKSSNGTFVMPQGNEQIMLQRNSALLFGKGTLSLGRQISLNAILIHYISN